MLIVRTAKLDKLRKSIGSDMFGRAARAFPEVSDGPISHLHHWAKITPNAKAMVGPNLTLTWQELLTQVQLVARWLREQELTGGVLIDAQDEYERIYSLACFHEGLFFAGLPASYDHAALKKLGFANILTVNPDLTSGHLKLIIISNSSLDSSTQGLAVLQPAEVASTDLVRVVFSSGTTGLPKPTPFTLELQNGRAESASEHYMKQAPFFTTVGFRTTAGSTCLFLDIWRGATNFTPGSPAANLSMIRRHKVRGIMGSPTALDALRLAAASSDSSDLEVEEIVSAGSFVHPLLANRLAETFGCKVTNVYGSTEAGLMAHSDATTTPNDVCELYPGVEIRIVGDEGQSLDSGQSGALLVKTPYMRVRYLDGDPFDPIDSGNLFNPGDLAELDSQGKLRLLGRQDDVINISGVKIAPKPIEDFAIESLGVSEAASMLATNQDGRNFHVMFVVSDEQLDPVELLKKLKSKFQLKSPQLVMQVPNIPKNEMGKVSRKAQIETLA